MTDDLRLTVDAAPDPGLLRPAIEAALAGRSWPPGPEARVAAAVAAAVRGRDAGGSGPGVGPAARTTRPPGIRTGGSGDHGGEDR